MLDTMLSRTPAVRRAQSITARILFRLGFTPGLATAAGLAAGVAAGVLLALQYQGIGLLLLFVSAFFDATDGTIARESATPTPFGGICDLVSDRIVEIAALVGIAWARPELHFAALVVAGSWYINITVFLATGAALEAGDKLIAYPPGMVERTEALIFFVLLVILHTIGRWLCWIYMILELFTAAQRLQFARMNLGSDRRPPRRSAVESGSTNLPA